MFPFETELHQLILRLSPAAERLRAMWLCERPCVCVLMLLCSLAVSVHSGNVLVWYTEGSHWINMKPLLETLVDRGHGVTVLLPNTSLYMSASEPSRYRYETFNTSVTMDGFDQFLQDFLDFAIYESPHMSYLQIFFKLVEQINTDIQLQLLYLDGVLKAPGVMARLREGRYDVLLADPIYVGSEMVAEVLDIPLVFTLRFSAAHTMERLCGQLPAPPSFVPGTLVKLTDRMSFGERLSNFLFYASQDLLATWFWRDIDGYYSEYRGGLSTPPPGSRTVLLYLVGVCVTGTQAGELFEELFGISNTSLDFNISNKLLR